MLVSDIYSTQYIIRVINNKNLKVLKILCEHLVQYKQLQFCLIKYKIQKFYFRGPVMFL